MMRRTSKAYAMKKLPKRPSQSRKRSTDSSDLNKGISYLSRCDLERWLKWLHDDQDHSWRWIARYSIGQPRYSWLQRVADGKQDVKPKYGDLLAVRRLYDHMQDRSDDDGKQLTIALEIMRLLGELNVQASALIKSKRSGA